MISDNFSIFLEQIAPSCVAHARTAARIFARTTRGGIYKMASKITSLSEANIRFVSSVSIPNLRQGLLEHSFECSHKSEDDSSDSNDCISIFSDNSVAKADARYVVRGITQCSTQFTKHFTAQRYNDTKNKD